KSVRFVAGEHVAVLDFDAWATYTKSAYAPILRKLTRRVANLSAEACSPWVIFAYGPVIFREGGYDGSPYLIIFYNRTEIAGADWAVRDPAAVGPQRKGPLNQEKRVYWVEHAFSLWTAKHRRHHNAPEAVAH